MRAVLISIALIAAACTPPAETPPADEPTAETPAAGPQTAEEATAQDTCGGAQYASFVGQNIAAVTYPADAGIRVLAPDSIATQDFRPDRINFRTDANGVITSIECF